MRSGQFTFEHWQIHDPSGAAAPAACVPICWACAGAAICWGCPSAGRGTAQRLHLERSGQFTFEHWQIHDPSGGAAPAACVPICWACAGAAVCWGCPSVGRAAAQRLHLERSGQFTFEHWQTHDPSGALASCCRCDAGVANGGPRPPPCPYGAVADNAATANAGGIGRCCGMRGMLFPMWGYIDMGAWLYCWCCCWCWCWCCRACASYPGRATLHVLHDVRFGQFTLPHVAMWHIQDPAGACASCALCFCAAVHVPLLPMVASAARPGVVVDAAPASAAASTPGR